MLLVPTVTGRANSTVLPVVYTMYVVENTTSPQVLGSTSTLPALLCLQAMTLLFREAQQCKETPVQRHRNMV